VFTLACSIYNAWSYRLTPSKVATYELRTRTSVANVQQQIHGIAIRLQQDTKRPGNIRRISNILEAT
jgi:hypothetical protein